jgi:hypothetical protein
MENLKGLEQTTDEELEEIKALMTSKVNISYDDNQIFYNLNPNSMESKNLEGKYPEFSDEVQEYGFLSPAVMVIEDYVNFFMTRYEESDPALRVEGKKRQDKIKNIRTGIKAEKTFDLILQNMALPFNYPEPIRDWRLGHGAPFAQTSDFYVPSLGKLEVKSVTTWCDKSTGKFIGYRINVPKPEWANAQPNYLVVLWHIGGRFVMLCGAMPAAKVASYEGTPFDRPGYPSFLSIPLEQLTISAKSLYKALLAAKSKVDTLDKIKI